MKIYLLNKNADAFWNYFAPKGMRLLQCQPVGGAMFYIIDLDRATRKYTKEEEDRIWAEVKMWLGIKA